MASGRKMGRPSKLSETQKKAICAAFHHQENSMSINALSKQFGVSRMTISRVVRKKKVG
jgi:transposase